MSIPTAPTSALDLTTLGNVPQAYRHEWRVSTPQSPIVIPGNPGGIFKWYHVHRDGVPVPEDLDALARKTITEAATTGTMGSLLWPQHRPDPRQHHPCLPDPGRLARPPGAVAASLLV